jgi:hypothetical protein
MMAEIRIDRGRAVRWVGFYGGFVCLHGFFRWMQTAILRRMSIPRLCGVVLMLACVPGFAWAQPLGEPIR